MASPIRSPLVRRVILAAALATALSACQTTGDPRHGGLFGWDEQKARERQAELAAVDAQAQQQVAAERGRETQLQTQQTGRQAASAQLQAETDDLLAQNARLEQQLRALMERRQIEGGQLARLQELLAANQRTRATAANARATPAAAEQRTRIDEQNERLHREVTILLQR